VICHVIQDQCPTILNLKVAAHKQLLHMNRRSNIILTSKQLNTTTNQSHNSQSYKYTQRTNTLGVLQLQTLFEDNTPVHAITWTMLKINLVLSIHWTHSIANNYLTHVMHVFTRATPNTIESTMDPHKQILHTKHTTPTFPTSWIKG